MRASWRLWPLVLVLTACVPAEPPPPAALPERPKVTLETYAKLAVFIRHSAPATVVARNEATAAAEVAANVLSIHADVGDVVTRGQVLVRLDARDAALAQARAAAGLAQAEARLAQTDASLRRAESLARDQFYSAEALAQRRTERAVVAADLAQAQAVLDTAQRAVDKHVLRAPFDGVVVKRQAQVGSLAAPGAPLLTLTDRAPTEIAAAVQVRDVAPLQDAPAVRFEGALETVPVHLLRIAAAVDRGARTQEARLAPAGGGLRAGMEGRIVWSGTQPQVPADLVVRRDGRYGVFVVEGEVARFVPIDGAQEGRPAPLAVPPGTLIAVDGRHALHDGMAVRR